jgi:LPXTG-site transpeptidase (sortase) family protein
MPRKEITKSQLKRPLQRPRPASSGISPTNIKTVQRRNLQEPSSIKSSSYQVIKSSSRKALNFDWLMKVFFFLGALFFIVYIGLRINQEIQLSIVTPQISSKQQPTAKETANPTQIVIPKVGIDLPIEETVITNGIWQISAKGASHLAMSARPDQEGTIIMYGHNMNNRFGPIRWLTKGEKIELRTSDGKKHVYVVSETKKVAPDRMDIFEQKGETLILYTCDGFADLQRFVVIAKKR